MRGKAEQKGKGGEGGDKERRLRAVPRLCQGCAKAVPRLCQGCAKAVPRLCLGCAKAVFLGCAKAVPRLCLGCALWCTLAGHTYGLVRRSETDDCSQRQ